MESAFAWFGQLVDWFGKFVPRWVILDTTEGAVKYVRGAHPVALAPGIHWYWPLITTLNTYPTARQADRLPTQTITTADGKTVILGAMVVYRVTNILTLLSQNHSATGTIRDIAMTAVHDVCCRMTWAELQDEQRRNTLDTKLKNKTRDALEEYGVAVVKVMLIDLALVRVLRISQSTSQEEN